MNSCHSKRSRLLMLFLVLSGCGGQSEPTSKVMSRMEGQEAPMPGAVSSEPAYDRSPMAGAPAFARRSGGPNMAEAVIDNIAGSAVARSAQADRKIIYTASVELVTENLEKLEQGLLEIIKQANGFVAETNQTGNIGGQRQAMWRVRVPVDQYDGFLQKARALGEVERVQVNSQDVTEEFVDVSARVAAKKVQEQRLIELIKNATAKLDEVLKVENELARVRAEIERMEGRIRFLKDQTELTTITINVREVKDYTPPEAPTFATRIRRAWADSIDLFKRNLENFTVAAVAWLPFMPVYVLFGLVGFWLARLVWRKIRPGLIGSLNARIVPTRIDETEKRQRNTP